MRSALLSGAAVLPLVCASCSGPTRAAQGDQHVLVLASPLSVWTAIETEVTTALQPRIFTVRDEKAFRVEFVAPDDPDWPRLRLSKSVIVIGRAGDFWVEPAVEGQVVAASALIEAENVWARGQQVSAIVVPDEGDAAATVRQILPRLSDRLDEQFREYALARMYYSGLDTTLADSLARTAGFALFLPNVYDHYDLGTTQVFRHHAEMGDQIMRNVAVTWRDGITEPPTQDDALAWRDSLAAYAYDVEQQIQRDKRIETRTLETPGTMEVQGIWQGTDPTWPTAGPFIVRVVPCPELNRTYFLDAWLFAPGKDKYEYMIQLETILGTFACGAVAGRTAGND